MSLDGDVIQLFFIFYYSWKIVEGHISRHINVRDVDLIIYIT